MTDLKFNVETDFSHTIKWYAKGIPGREDLVADALASVRHWEALEQHLAEIAAREAS